MSSTKPTAQQIAVILEEPEDGASIEAACRKAGISIATYYRWYKKYGRLRPSRVKRLRHLENENARLKLLVAMWSFDKELHQSPVPLHAVEPSASADGVATAPAPGPEMPRVLEVREQTPVAESPREANGYAVSVPRKEPRAEAEPRLRRLRELGAHAMAGAARANAWIRSRSQGLSLGRLKQRSVESWRTAKSRHSRALVVVGVAGGLVAGFAFGMSSAPQDNTPLPVPVDYSVRFNTHRSYVNALGEGWSKPDSWGTWMADKHASVLMGFDGPARGDVDLLLEARSRPAKGSKPQTIVVRFNEAELGRWKLPAEPRELRRRFIVPQAVFNRSTAARLTFETADGTARPQEFGLRGLSLQDAGRLGSFRGFLDHCGTEKLVGWAVAEDSAVSILATADGAPLEATFANVERPDLAPHGLPADAGFELTLAKPVPAQTLIEVRFANGQRLIGSPCRM